MLLSVLLVAVVAASGWGLTYWVPVRLRVEERCALGVVLGSLAFCGFSFGMFLVVGMNTATVAVGALLPALWAVTYVEFSGAHRIAPEARQGAVAFLSSVLAR